MEVSVTMERDCDNATPQGWKGKAIRRSHASHSKHITRGSPVHNGRPHRAQNDDDVPTGGVIGTRTVSRSPDACWLESAFLSRYCLQAFSGPDLLGPIPILPIPSWSFPQKPRTMLRHCEMYSLVWGCWFHRLSCYIPPGSVTQGRPQRHHQAQEILLQE